MSRPPSLLLSPPTTLEKLGSTEVVPGTVNSSVAQIEDAGDGPWTGVGSSLSTPSQEKNVIRGPGGGGHVGSHRRGLKDSKGTKDDLGLETATR